LPEAVQVLREVRRTHPDGHLIAISAADPLNLSGIVTAGERIRVAGRNRIVYRDGVPLAVREGEFVRSLVLSEDKMDDELLRALSPRSAQYGHHTFA
jgi:ATP-dependent Lhr-like helicase